MSKYFILDTGKDVMEFAEECVNSLREKGHAVIVCLTDHSKEFTVEELTYEEWIGVYSQLN